MKGEERRMKEGIPSLTFLRKMAFQSADLLTDSFHVSRKLKNRNVIVWRMNDHGPDLWT